MLRKVIRKHWPWLKHMFADGAYDRARLIDAAACRDFVYEIMRPIVREPAFKVQKRQVGN